MGFRPLPPQSPHDIGTPCRSTHQVWEATEGPFRHLLPFAAIAGVGPPFLIRRFASRRLHRQRGLVSCGAGEHSPHDPRVLVGESNGRDIGMPPLPNLAEPEASWILLAASPA